MSIPRETLAKYLQEGDNYAETGCRWGDTLIKAAECGARNVAGCEIDDIICAIARQHVCEVLARTPCGVCIVCQDSSDFLTTPPFSADVVFLDAHTAEHSPITAELRALASWAPHLPNVILIDDIRLFRSLAWGISLEDVIAELHVTGRYEISFDTGIQPEDILVARLK